MNLPFLTGLSHDHMLLLEALQPAQIFFFLIKIEKTFFLSEL